MAWQLLLDVAGDLRQLPAEQPGNLKLAAANPFIDLYLPLCQPAKRRSQVLAHLGQSIDGYIATASGDSEFVNDQENIRHLHRLRAVHDAVIVGAGTIAADNPQLTTRRVPGPNPVRVILDPRRRLPPTSHVFTDDAAKTILVVGEAAGGADSHGQAQVLFVPEHNGAFDLGLVVESLAKRGLRKLFVEGGGTTVSRFFDAGMLDRLQIAIAPVFIGRGKPGLRLPENDGMDDCPRPLHRIFSMGQDIFFDCDLKSDNATAEHGTVAVQSSRQDDTVPIRRIR